MSNLNPYDRFLDGRPLPAILGVIPVAGYVNPVIGEL